MSNRGSTIGRQSLEDLLLQQAFDDIELQTQLRQLQALKDQHRWIATKIEVPDAFPVRYENRGTEDRVSICDFIDGDKIDRDSLEFVEAKRRCLDFETLQEKSIVNVIDELRGGQLIAEGTIEPPSHELSRIEISAGWWERDDTWVSFSEGWIGIRQWKKVGKYACSPTYRRVFSDVTVEKASGNARRPGRPSRAPQIKRIYELLLEAGKIDFNKPQNEAIRQVRAEVMRVSRVTPTVSAWAAKISG